MRMIVLLIAAALAGWAVWTSMGGGQVSGGGIREGGPKPVIDAANGAVDALNEANRKQQENLRQAVPRP